MKENVPTMTKKDPLKFHVAPHIVQDLGLNLYTSLPRVLVEFVANAYDADSPVASITMDLEKIDQARKDLQKQWKAKQSSKASLAEQTLDESLTIEVEDSGHGMSRDELQEKFLIAGRRRREGGAFRSPKDRILMGRKGLGKLAGFGVAHCVTVVSRKAGENHATKIVLDYDELIKHRLIHEVPIVDKTLKNGGGFESQGTRIILSRLVFEPLKSKEATIANAIGDHFSDIAQSEFLITLNGKSVRPTPRTFVFAYPADASLDMSDLVDHEYAVEGKKVKFQYRIKFTGPSKQMTAGERGVRIYAHNRLASSPNLLDMKTGIHGFHNTHYLYGVVRADFIDDEETDYIATDRTNLRWETPLLLPMRTHLSKRDGTGLQGLSGDTGKKGARRGQERSIHQEPNQPGEPPKTSTASGL